MPLPLLPSSSLLRVCLSLATALFLVIAASPTPVSAQVADTARTAAIDSANARAVDLFRALSEAKTDSARDQAISTLYTMVRSKAPEEHEAVAHYGMSAFMTSGDEKKQAEYTERRDILARVIPLMFATLTGDVQDKAWWVLINVQDASFPPKRALWDQWWRNKGKAIFAPAETSPPVAVPVSDPAPAAKSAPVPKARPVPEKPKAKKK